MVLLSLVSESCFSASYRIFSIFFLSSQFSRKEIWHTSVEVCYLCFDQLDQTLVCFDRLNPGLIYFDRLDPSCICLVYARPRNKIWAGGNCSDWVQSRFFVTEKRFKSKKQAFDQSSTEEFCLTRKSFNRGKEHFDCLLPMWNVSTEFDSEALSSED